MSPSRRFSLKLRMLVTWLAMAPICQAADPATDILAEFPIRRNAAVLMVPVQFQGRTLQFMLDTGCSLIIFDKAFEGQLGPYRKTMTLRTTSDSTLARLHSAPEAMLGPLSLRTEDFVACCDLGFVEQRGLGRVDGVIGMSFLGRYALTLDFTLGKIQFRREANCPADRAIPLRLDPSGVPLIQVALPGEVSRPYQLDTGFASEGTIKTGSSAFERLARHPRSHPAKNQQSVGLGGIHSERSCLLDGVKVAGFTLVDVPVVESKSGSQVIGMGIVRRLNWTLDFPRQRMVASRNWFW